MKWIATVVFAVGILGLFSLDGGRRGQRSPVSRALWLPVVWLSLGASRLVSEWLGDWPPPVDSPDRYLDGSPLDRFVLSALLAIGVGVLLRRRRQLGRILRANGPVLAFLLYAGLSVVWSDYPEVAIKRWTKILGDLLMALIVLTEPDTLEAVKRLLARVAFLLVPISVLFIKYYPDLGRGYDRWTWTPFYSGVATSKNGLGIVCLIAGLASLWRLLEGLGETPSGHCWLCRCSTVMSRDRGLVAHAVVLLMTLWLFTMANSATCLGAFLLCGGLIVAVSHVRTRPAAVVHLVATIACLGALALVFGSSVGLAQAMGRDSTLTGRTALWNDLLNIVDDAWFGTGFESFWLGPRAILMWETHWWHPNQAHNGYLEVFLNLGGVGVVLFAAVIVSGYRKVIRGLTRDAALGRLRLAFFVAAVLYNVTEAAVKMMHPVWMMFLLAVITVPRGPVSRDRTVPDDVSSRPRG